MIRIAEISYQGNLSKTYEFYTDFHTIKEGDHAVCETANGLSMGRVMRIKSYSERSSMCKAWLFMHFNKDSFGDHKQREIDRAMALSDEELKELLG